MDAFHATFMQSNYTGMELGCRNVAVAAMRRLAHSGTGKPLLYINNAQATVRN
jgi:hypothetical protein